MTETPDYSLVANQISALAEGERYWLPLLSNAAALLDEALADVNWVGFYLGDSLLRGADADVSSSHELVLGPFAGKVACTHILYGRGVCGTAAERDETLRVDDVHAFAGHIACDAASRSEIVVPIHRDGVVVGVLDIDSPLLARFSAADQEGLELCVAAIERLWP